MGKKILLVLVIATIAAFAFVLTRAFKKTRDNPEARAAAANLIVYTHSSFIDAYGPGADIKAEFEKTCACTVEYIDAGGATAAIERLRLDPSRRVDVVMGINLLLLQRLGDTVKLQQLSPQKTNWRPEVFPFVYPRFLPYDWSPMGFIYRTGETKPVTSWQQALSTWAPQSVSLQDPTLSAPGLELLYWLFAISSDEPGERFADYLGRLKPVVHSYSPGWSASYGLFKKGEAKVTFSYLTSLIYHWKEEKDAKYQFMVFDEGHPAELEYAAVPESCWNCGVAKDFVAFLLTPAVQTILAKKSYMLPVIKEINEVDLDPAYMKLPKVRVLGDGSVKDKKLDDFARQRDTLLEQWRTAR